MVIQNKYEIIRTIYENDFQRILECKEEETEKIFINNIIFNQGIINLIEEEKIKNVFDSKIDLFKTEDRLYIQTEPCNYTTFKDYVNNKELTLKQQFKLTEQIIELGDRIFDMSDLVQCSILKYDNLCIDDDENICTNNILIFDQNYDISENITLKIISDIIHYIFSKQTINDYDISDKIPPDILKIVVRCLTKEYSIPKDALEDLYGSQIYKLVNPKTNLDEYEDKTEKVETNEEELFLEEDSIETEDIDEESIKEEVKAYDEYENEFIDYEDNDDSDIKFPLMKVVVPLIVVIVLVPLLFFGYKKISNNSEPTSNVPTDTDNTTKSSIDTPVDNGDDQNSTSSAIDDDITNIPDEIDKYLNQTLVKKTGFEGTIARKSTEYFYEGNCSLLAENTSSENDKILFAVFDIDDEEFSYLKNRQIGISVNLKAKKNVEAMLVIETFTNDKISANSSDKVEIYNDIWTLKQIVIDVGNIDRIDAYIEYAGKNKVWVDNIEIDILK